MPISRGKGFFRFFPLDTVFFFSSLLPFGDKKASIGEVPDKDSQAKAGQTKKKGKEEAENGKGAGVVQSLSRKPGRPLEERKIAFHRQNGLMDSIGRDLFVVQDRIHTTKGEEDGHGKERENDGHHGGSRLLFSDTEDKEQDIHEDESQGINADNEEDRKDDAEEKANWRL